MWVFIKCVLAGDHSGSEVDKGSLNLVQYWLHRVLAETASARAACEHVQYAAVKSSGQQGVSTQSRTITEPAITGTQAIYIYQFPLVNKSYTFLSSHLQKAMRKRYMKSQKYMYARKISHF